VNVKHLLHAAFLILGLMAAVPAYSQREQQIQPPDELKYGRKFFVQLRGVFGRFRDIDLDRAFEKAEPIQCSELVNDTGEWRTVAFFNENRSLGDWYRSNLEEVKSDPAVFIFKGACRGDRGAVQVTTKFPVTESIEAYNQRRIALDEVEINVNAPVAVSFDSQTQAYTFDLPYLFLVEQRDNENVYSLDPPRLADRTTYAPDVTEHWDCKSVTADAVTYQFLICRTTTQPRNPRLRSQDRPGFGSSAYFILSDGREASSNVKLSFNGTDDTTDTFDDNNVVQAPAAWETPDSDERLLDLLRNDFRLIFAGQSWTGRVGAAQVLYGRQLTSLQSSNPADGADYCIWLPGAGGSANALLNDPGTSVAYSTTVHDPDGQSATSIVFDINLQAGPRLGSLQCTFPRAQSAAGITFGRWKSIVGDHLTIEVR
jgi:hypothetical protein